MRYEHKAPGTDLDSKVYSRTSARERKNPTLPVITAAIRNDQCCLDKMNDCNLLYRKSNRSWRVVLEEICLFISQLCLPIVSYLHNLLFFTCVVIRLCVYQYDTYQLISFSLKSLVITILYNPFNWNLKKSSKDDSKNIQTSFTRLSYQIIYVQLAMIIGGNDSLQSAFWTDMLPNTVPGFLMPERSWGSEAAFKYPGFFNLTYSITISYFLVIGATSENDNADINKNDIYKNDNDTSNIINTPSVINCEEGTKVKTFFRRFFDFLHKSFFMFYHKLCSIYKSLGLVVLFNSARPVIKFFLALLICFWSLFLLNLVCKCLIEEVRSVFSSEIGIDSVGYAANNISSLDVFVTACLALGIFVVLVWILMIFRAKTSLCNRFSEFNESTNYLNFAYQTPSGKNSNKTLFFLRLLRTYFSKVLLNQIQKYMSWFYRYYVYLVMGIFLWKIYSIA